MYKNENDEKFAIFTETIMHLVYPPPPPPAKFPITIFSNICPQLVAPEASRVLLKSSAVGMGGLRGWPRGHLSKYFGVSK